MSNRRVGCPVSDVYVIGNTFVCSIVLLSWILFTVLQGLSCKGPYQLIDHLYRYSIYKDKIILKLCQRDSCTDSNRDIHYKAKITPTLAGIGIPINKIGQTWGHIIFVIEIQILAGWEVFILKGPIYFICYIWKCERILLMLLPQVVFQNVLWRKVRLCLIGTSYSFDCLRFMSRWQHGKIAVKSLGPNQYWWIYVKKLIPFFHFMAGIRLTPTVILNVT